MDRLTCYRIPELGKEKKISPAHLKDEWKWYPSKHPIPGFWSRGPPGPDSLGFNAPLSHSTSPRSIHLCLEKFVCLCTEKSRLRYRTLTQKKKKKKVRTNEEQPELKVPGSIYSNYNRKLPIACTGLTRTLEQAKKILHDHHIR